MNRKEAYELVKQYELEDTLKEKYGVNYTNLTTRTLEDEIEEYEDQDEKAKDDSYCDEDNQTSAYEAACLAFLGVLKDSGALEGLLDQL